MARLEVNILGCGSATPTLRHQPSSQVVNYADRLFMIDCGEGAQLQMRRMKLKFSRLNHIFLTHLHGDHFLGLPGLLSTMAFLDKGAAVVVHTFQEGADILAPLMKFVCGETPFDLKFDILKPKQHGIIYEDNTLEISCFPLYHRVPTLGYMFREKPKQRHIKGDMAQFYGIPHYRIPEIRLGADYVTPEGIIVPNARLTTEPEPALSYAYCSDTMFDPRVAEYVGGVHTLYHEATYAQSEAEMARPRGHSTAAEAGRIARMAGAQRLVIGHYSKRYISEDQLLAEARAEFSGEVIAANEGMTIR